jgi:hypothetical protein
MSKQMFTSPGADVLAAIELEEARIQLLAAHSALEYAAAMVDYNSQRVNRLEASNAVYFS